MQNKCSVSDLQYSFLNYFCTAIMNVFTDIESLPLFPHAVITTGSFDGVHFGHVQIIEQLLKEAEKIKGTPVIITFYPHPKHVVAGHKTVSEVKDDFTKTVFTLNTSSEKYALLKSKGIENIVVVPFNKAFSELSAKQYIEDFIVKKFHPEVIVVGYDHRFGNNREGNFELLKSAGPKYNFEVHEIPEHVIKNITISSTAIRKALLSGDVETAASFLGYPYSFSGIVTEGNKLGRTIGFPTANLQVDDAHKLIPANGVYAVDIECGQRNYRGMMNIGMRPTVGGTGRVIEVNIFNFNKNIYGETIKVHFKKRLRDEMKFTGLQELKKQLEIDKEEASQIRE